MICLKIRTFVVSATTINSNGYVDFLLWFAWKFVPLWYQQQRAERLRFSLSVVICLKIRTFVVSATTLFVVLPYSKQLWFAWKFVPLWYQQQQYYIWLGHHFSCDLLENSYLCGISNNLCPSLFRIEVVVICLKIRTFVVSATTRAWQRF